ncbi:MAG: hypothetical protein SPJ97_00150 [Bacteroides sp.]|nr:hypothetical protein [Bacteroides sp.]
MDIYGLYSEFKPLCGVIAAIGFLLAGIGVVKTVLSNPDKAKRAITSYIVALVVFILLWSLL